MGKSAPPTPDYRGAAQETAEASKEVTNMQTYANRPDQVNPWGSTTWTNEQVRDPATGQMMTKWNQNQELAPDSKAALDSQLALTRGKSDLAGGMMGRVADEFGSQMDWDQFGDLNRGVQAEAIDMGDLPAGASALDYSGASAVGDSQAQRDRAEQAIFDRSSSRLNDRFGGQQQAMEIKLANQGLRPGDQAYDAEMKNLGQERNDAYSSAMNDAITGGGAEASRTFGMDMSRRGMMTGETGAQADFANQARRQALGEQVSLKDRGFDQGMQQVNYANSLRDQAIKEEMNKRGTSLNEMNALLTGQQVNRPQMQNFSDATRAQGADYSGAMQDTYRADLNAASARNAGIENAVGLGSDMMGMFSDRRLKKNIQRIGEWMGYPLYIFEYLWGDWSVGVMSDEINQDAVFKHPSGYDMVNYGKVK
tara:strand:- start:99 stop:1367 length:1269 start_codon:yes stop_codon:yes gene_type:complete